MDEDRFFKEAEKEAQKSTCLKAKVGAVIVKNGKIVGRGSNFCSPEGFKHGEKVEACPRSSLPTGESYHLCKNLHAELVAVLRAKREDCRGAVMYLFGHYYPCWHCKSLTRLAGIKEIKCCTSEDSFYKKHKGIPRKGGEK